jgi:glycerol-3-phosphate O-acyltransferase
VSYHAAAKKNAADEKLIHDILNQFLKLLDENLRHPFSFDHFHRAIVEPFNYYKFGLDFIRPLVRMQESHILHVERLTEICQHLAKGENVVFFANHQTELDPQVISLLLEGKELAQEMIFVAGHRVTSDPMAVPFSKGRNLLCIYSKKYIEDDPTTKEQKLMHNQLTMRRMTELLSEGGKCIYVAPSGGRDRRNKEGKIEVAAFDSQSIEMFFLMAQKAEKVTHFYPLALATYHLLPPPDTIKKQIGEPRHVYSTAVHMAIGHEINMETFPGSDSLDKKQKRKLRAEYIWGQVKKDYEKLIS